jgi:nicotinic acid phosphoribosyltransferase
MKERREYRCTRNAPYKHNCIGHDDIRERQGHYVWANSEEEAWEKMAKQYPDETADGFTTQEWEGFNVIIREVRRDDPHN